MNPAAPRFVDTHVHLTDPQFDPDRAAVLAAAEAAGVDRLVEIGDSPEDWPRVLAFARSRPASARCALGLHPYYADQCTDALLARLEAESASPEVVAIGEIGLDYAVRKDVRPDGTCGASDTAGARGPVAPEAQKPALRRLLTLCRGLGKPAVIHCRGAYADLREIVAEVFPSPPSVRAFWGVVHCFSGSPDDAEAFAAAGFAIGADGPVTYPKNEVLREAFRRVGPRATVLETDSPYLPPQSCRGRRNEPKAVCEIAEVLARVWGISGAEAARATTATALALFGWP